MPRSRSKLPSEAEAARRMLDEMDFAVAALGALVAAARRNGASTTDARERMEDLANRLLDLSQTGDGQPDGTPAFGGPVRVNLQ